MKKKTFYNTTITKKTFKNVYFFTLGLLAQLAH